MNKVRYKLVYNPSALYEYQLYKKVWIFWTVVCRTNYKSKIEEYLRMAGKPTVKYYNDKGKLIENGIENS